MSEHNQFPVVSVGSIGGGSVQTVNARDLHAFLQVKSEFRHWIKNRVDDFGFVENQDFVTVGKNLPGGGKQNDYFVTIDMAKELSMVERNEQGKKARQYFIECERRARDPQVALNHIPTLRQLLLDNVERVMELEHQVDEMLPTIEAFEQIAGTHGSMNRTEAAKHLGVPPHVLCKWMRTNGWTYRRAGAKDDLAYQSKMNAGYLEHKVSTGPKADGTEWIGTQVRVTPKGLTVLAKAFPPAARAA